MKKIFVTYGDELYMKSLEGICGEARQSGEFDEVVAYTRVDLPDSIKSNVLFSYKRGGGGLVVEAICLPKDFGKM